MHNILKNISPGKSPGVTVNTNKRLSQVILPATLSILMTAIISCSPNPSSAPNTANTGLQQTSTPVLNKTKIKTGATITLRINPKLMRIKASVDGAPAKTLDDVVSYSAFLTDDPVDPFSEGANPDGDDVVVSVDETPDTVSFTFEDVPEGGPYYAVVAAYDALSDETPRTNITAPNSDIESPDNQWAISTNNVTVDEDFLLTYSDGSDALDVIVQLHNALSPVIETRITPQDGSSGTSGTFSAS